MVKPCWQEIRPAAERGGSIEDKSTWFRVSFLVVRRRVCNEDLKARHLFSNDDFESKAFVTTILKARHTSVFSTVSCIYKWRFKIKNLTLWHGAGNTMSYGTNDESNVPLRRPTLLCNVLCVQATKSKYKNTTEQTAAVTLQCHEQELPF